MLANLSNPSTKFLSLLLPIHIKILLFDIPILITRFFTPIIFAAMPTQPTRLTSTVSNKSLPICRSAFVAATYSNYISILSFLLSQAVFSPCSLSIYERVSIFKSKIHLGNTVSPFHGSGTTSKSRS